MSDGLPLTPKRSQSPRVGFGPIAIGWTGLYQSAPLESDYGDVAWAQFARPSRELKRKQRRIWDIEYTVQIRHKAAFGQAGAIVIDASAIPQVVE